MRSLSFYGRRPTSLWDFMGEFERAFDSSLSQKSDTFLSFNPAVDIDEDEAHYLISVDLPGVEEKDIKVDVHLNQLSISGERKFETKKESDQNRFYERSFGKFKRTFALPNEVNADDIQAQFSNGVLQVYVPKVAKAQPKSVKIESGKGRLFSRLLGDKKEDETPNGH